MSNTTSSSGADARPPTDAGEGRARPRVRRPCAPARGGVICARGAAPIALLLLTAAACAHHEAAAPPPVLEPQSVLIEPEPVRPLEQIRAQAEQQYRLGVEAQERGDIDAADRYFDAALQVFMDADIPPGQEDAFRAAFNDLVLRVQAQQIDEFEMTPEARAPDLPIEEIPPLSEAELDLLRARLADTLPAMPRFSIPVHADNPQVLAALDYLVNERREVVQEGLNRATRYLPLIREVFAQSGVPEELAWVPLIESLFKPTARSRAGAVGLWQLMAPTARLYGLRVDWYVDERRDPIKSTHAIARFIRDYYEEFGDWHLAIAAYNGGKGRVARALRRAGATDFWHLATTRYLPRETREFVPKILAAVLVGSDPEAYDFTVEPQPVFAFDAVAIDSMTDLEVIAEAAGTDLATIRELNPALLRRTTPNVKGFTIRVPAGRGETFRRAYAAIPPKERLRVAEHVVRRGETLSEIADEFGVSWRAIADFNGIRNPRRIRAGQRLLVPVSQAMVADARTVRRDLVQGSSEPRRGERIVHTVRRGESLWLIARAYGTTVADIKRWNHLTSDRIVRGDRLEIYYRTRGAPPAAVSAAGSAASDGGGESAAPPTASIRYRVQRGDTLSDIARVYGVTVADIKRWNGKRSDRIYPGEQLLIHSRRLVVAEGGTTYTVRRGDTLSGIAHRFGVSIEQLCAWNGISPRTTLYPGNRLVIRTGDR